MTANMLPGEYVVSYVNVLKSVVYLGGAMSHGLNFFIYDLLCGYRVAWYTNG